MKKTTLIIAALCVVLFSSFRVEAQTWAAPSYKSSTPVSGTNYYLYNVGSKGFLTRGASWGAMATVAAFPNGNAAPSTFISWTALNTTGSSWTFQYNNGSNVSNNYLFPASTSDGSVYTDNSTENSWTLTQTDATNNIYAIQIASTYAGYNAAQYFGSDAALETTNKGKANPARYNRAESAYTQWKFVSPADYQLYNAKVVLDRYMRYAKAAGNINLTSYIATYNADVTADINTAATNLLTALNRTAISGTNLSFESALGSEWTNTGSFARQSNTPGMGWVKDGTQYCEKYTGSVGYLSTGALTQNVAVPNGLYGLVVSAHAVQQAGANPLNSGAFIFAGNKYTEVTVGQDYFVDSISVTNGTLPVGFALQGNVQVNWLGFDNFRIYKYATYTTPALASSPAALWFDELAPSSSITVTGSNLTSDITITVPAGITLSGTNLISNGSGSYSIAQANANTTNTFTVTYNGTGTVNGTITMNGTGNGSQTVSSNIQVKASTNSACFTPAYSTGNMIADPTFSAADLATGGFGGWGPTGIINNNAYCGKGTAYVRGSCWPDGGSLDRTLSSANGNALKANSRYRLRAMIKSQASVPNSYFQFEIDGYDGTKSLFVKLPNSNGWRQVDTTFTTGATVTTGKGIYFNSCGSVSPAITDTCFIDNYELYEIPFTTATNNLQQAQQKIYLQNNSIVSEFLLNKATNVNISVFDLQGKLLMQSVSRLEAGFHSNKTESKLPAGVYFVKVSSPEFVISQKIIK